MPDSTNHPVDSSQHQSPTNSPPSYIGRFAPSPSGPLHMGSLVAALASYLDARSNHGKWLVRMEDLDPPRESKEAADQILDALDKTGLHWDGSVLYQSQRKDAYLEALEILSRQDLIFACNCTRQQIQESGGVYPGTCRLRHLAEESGKALRCRVTDEVISFTDLIQAFQSQHLQDDIGDFVVKRKDGLFAYQLAVVVDDDFQKISHIVRGIDLMDSTARQIYLQQKLGFQKPCYAHIPVIVNQLGQKLSKQHKAKPIDPDDSVALLLEALRYLNQDPDPALNSGNNDDILKWGIAHWNPARLTDRQEISEFEAPL